MSSGDKFVTSFLGHYGVKLLDAETQTTSGVWVDCSNILSGSIEFSGLESGGTVTIQVTNAPTIPANSTDGFVVLTLTSVSNAFQLINTAFPSGFIKAKKSVAGGSPTATTVYLRGISR